MKRFILLTFLLLMIMGAGSVSAQDFHCHKAWRKDWKSNKKEYKVRRKMFHDRPMAALRKRNHSAKKDWKSKRKEYEHAHHLENGLFWY